MRLVLPSRPPEGRLAVPRFAERLAFALAALPATSAMRFAVAGLSLASIWSVVSARFDPPLWSLGPFLSRAVVVALRLPPLVRSLPPRAVAPSPPTEVMRPLLSRVRRFDPLLRGLAAGRPLLTPPPPANRPRESRL
jgi:hypothetical protein